jgi:transcriptional regulator with XRE-family HTH domain
MWRGAAVQLVVSFLMRRRGPALPDLQRRLAANLKRLRLEEGISQEELASSAGLVSRHVQKLEAGDVNATLKTLNALANALHVDVSDLLSTKANA